MSTARVLPSSRYTWKTMNSGSFRHDPCAMSYPLRRPTCANATGTTSSTHLAMRQELSCPLTVRCPPLGSRCRSCESTASIRRISSDFCARPAGVMTDWDATWTLGLVGNEEDIILGALAASAGMVVAGFTGEHFGQSVPIPASQRAAAFLANRTQPS